MDPEIHDKLHIALILQAGIEYGYQLAQGVTEYCRSHPELYVSELIVYPEDATPPKTSRKFDGAIVWMPGDCQWIPDFLASGVQGVACSSHWPADLMPRVCYSERAFCTHAYEHLAARNFQHFAKIGHCGFPANQFEDSEEIVRNGGGQFHSVVLEGGSPCVDRRQLTDPTCHEELLAFLRVVPKPIGIWCYNDYIGVYVCEAASHLGYSVPDEVAVVGLGNYSISETARIPLSSVPLCGEKVGFAAVRYLHALLSGREDELPPGLALVPDPVISRESTGADPALDSVEAARVMIVERACEGITVAEVADSLGLSRSNLTKLYGKRHGHSPSEAIRRVRIEQAKYYLLHEELPVNQVATICGFNDVANFRVFFKRETGICPQKFRGELE